MSDSLADLRLLDRYSTNRNRLVDDFYRPCLARARTYDRAAGYFRSSAFKVAGQPLAQFASSGGRMRLICSPELTQQDISAMELGYAGRDTLDLALQRDLATATADIVGKHAVEILATLVSIGCLDIRIAFRPRSAGIFHDKLGIFRDATGNVVTFMGSSNETAAAWSAEGNHESFDVFRSWLAEASRVEQHCEYFERLWAGNEPGVETIEFPNVARSRLVSLANPDGIEAAYETETATSGARFLYPHQSMAIEEWERRGWRGILEHATGSGKTLTALHAVRRWLAMDRPAVILVPSEILLDQWHGEIRRELSDLAPRLLLAGAGHGMWRERDLLEAFTEPGGGPRLVLATIQTAAKANFRERVRSGSHLMIAIDEVHRAGAPSFSTVLSINAGGRLGLSATPTRYGDPDGTRQILQYFEGVVPPPFTLSDALAAGRLCRYVYRVHEAQLGPKESEEWLDLTAQIRREVARSDDPERGLSDRAKLLLIRRADIAKSAASKVPLAGRVIAGEYAEGHRWLVYCDDRSQLDAVDAAIRSAGIPTLQYYSAMQSDKQTVLAHFRTLGGVLVAIKCLDEGVDIPDVDHALILASSRNPREFIQRRGRVLRKAPSKVFAYVHDALVLPLSDDADETSLLRGELARAVAFAEDASNLDTRFALRELSRRFGLGEVSLSTRSAFETPEDEAA